MAGRGAVGRRGLWPRTGKAWAFVVLGLLTFLVLDVFTLRGADLALPLIRALAA